MRVKPDKPVISINPGNLDQYDAETRALLKQIYSDQQQAQAKAKNEECRAYQTEQADSLIEAAPSWIEVDLRENRRSVEKGEFDSFVYRLVVEQGGAYDEQSDKLIPLEDLNFSELSSPSIHQFYHDLYGASGVALFDPEEYQCSILVNHRAREHPYQLYEDYWAFIDGVKPETSFIYMGSFWQPPSGFLIAKRNAMKTLGGFCVDIDRFEDDKGLYFDAGWVMRSLVEVFEETPELEPNYLMLSGTGIQLWYVFGRQIPLLSAKKSPRRGKYERLLRLLYEWFDERLPKNRFKVDVPCATISHAFRAPGSPSKHHYPTRLFVKNGRMRDMVNPLDLSHFLGGDLMPYDLEDWNQEAYERLKEESRRSDWKTEPATVKQIEYLDKLAAWHCIEEIPETLTKAEADQLIKQGELVATRHIQYKQTEGGFIKTSEGRMVKRKSRYPNLYAYTRDRMKVETPAGSRYNAMFGLAGLAWNCAVPKSQVKSDLMGLLDTDWARKLGHDGLPLEEKDVKDALMGYHPLGALRKREQLEQRLSWKFNPPAKRNGRKQSEHMRYAYKFQQIYREIGEMEHVAGRPKGSGTKEEEIKAFAAEHPNMSNRQIAEALGVHRNTVNKWLKDN